MTLIGTSTNILVSGVVNDQGLAPFGMFEITKMGLIYAAIGAAYMLLIGRKLLPSRDTLSSLLSAEDTRSFYTHALIQENSAMIGKPLAETPLGKSRSARIFEVIRDGHRITNTPLDELICKQGDMLVLTAPSRGIALIRDMNGLDFGSETSSEEPVNPSSLRLVEAIVGSKRKFDRPVLVKLGGNAEVERLGFITQTDLSHIGVDEGKVAVYLPHAFNWSGNLYIVPTRNITPIDARAADVMKFVVSGGVSQVDDDA